MPGRIELEVWACVDEAGDYRVGITRDEAIKAYRAEFDMVGAIEVYQLFVGGVPIPAAKVVKVVLSEDAIKDGVIKLDVRRTDLAY